MLQHRWRKDGLGHSSTGRAVVLLFAGAALVLPVTASAQSVRGSVRDARTGAPIVSALIRLGLTEHYTVSDEDGDFRLHASGTTGVHSLVVTAPGYARRYEPADVDEDAEVAILMAPEPIELGGVEASVMTFRTRMRRRMNAAAALGTTVYAIDGALLDRSTAEHVWDLVRRRHGFRFEGFSDYGCPRATIFGQPVIADLYIDDRPVTINRMQEFRPQDFAVVEVINHGSGIRAYTQEYIDWMTENDRIAVPYGMIPGLCPPAETPPGTLKRGRPVGNP